MPSGGPTVTVVVPTFNGARLIGRCLESLLAQRDETVDVVVVDDGSEDGTMDVVAEYPVRVLPREHRGVAATRNAGLRAARADLVGFCDQDDEWDPDKATRQCVHLRSNPALDAVLCRHRVEFDGVDRPEWLVADGRGDLGGVLPLSGVFRADALAAVGGFDEALVGNDDLDLLVRLREHGHDLETLDAVLLTHHVHATNASHALGSYAPGIFDVYRRRARRSRA